MPPPDTFGFVTGFDSPPQRGSSTEVAPGIFKTPNVCGGSACVGRTRIPVWILESYRRLGATDAWVLQNYPTLTADHLVQAAAYARDNQAEMDEEIRENDEA